MGTLGIYRKNSKALNMQYQKKMDAFNSLLSSETNIKIEYLYWFLFKKLYKTLNATSIPLNNKNLIKCICCRSLLMGISVKQCML